MLEKKSLADSLHISALRSLTTYLLSSNVHVKFRLSDTDYAVKWFPHVVAQLGDLIDLILSLVKHGRISFSGWVTAEHLRAADLVYSRNFMRYCFSGLEKSFFSVLKIALIKNTIRGKLCIIQYVRQHCETNPVQFYSFLSTVWTKTFILRKRSAQQIIFWNWWLHSWTLTVNPLPEKRSILLEGMQMSSFLFWPKVCSTVCTWSADSPPPSSPTQNRYTRTM